MKLTLIYRRITLPFRLLRITFTGNRAFYSGLNMYGVRLFNDYIAAKMWQSLFIKTQMLHNRQSFLTVSWGRRDFNILLERRTRFSMLIRAHI